MDVNERKHSKESHMCSTENIVRKMRRQWSAEEDEKNGEKRGRKKKGECEGEKRRLQRS